MSTALSWADIALRLALAVATGLAIGYNRSEHGKAVGLRTTVLVCLAACVAMIQVNLLLPMAGRPADSFVMNDLMRLPLGILTGVGFIGGGAILRRDNIVVGVTTAATMWLVTVIGLCLGGGQITLGLAATAIGLFALWPLNRLEGVFSQEHRADLSVELDGGGPSDEEIRHQISQAGFSITGTTVDYKSSGAHRMMALQLRRMRRLRDIEPPGLVRDLIRAPGVVGVRWKE